jgi:hypothetical protein
MFIICLLLWKINNLNSNFRFIYIGTIDQTIINCCLWSVLFLCAILLIKKRWLVIKIILAICILLLIIRINWHYHRIQNQIFIFNSPEHTHTLLVEDYNYTTFYRKESNFIYKRLSVGLTSGVPFVAPSWGAFERNEYSVDWLTDDIALVSFRLMRETNFEVSIDLSKMKSYKGDYVRIK